MTTGKKPASEAGQELQDPETPEEERTVAASALAQAKPKDKDK